MNRVPITIAWLALTLPSTLAIAQEASARTVEYHSSDIVPIRAKVKFTTLIEVPPTRPDNCGEEKCGAHELSHSTPDHSRSPLRLVGPDEGAEELVIHLGSDRV